MSLQPTESRIESEKHVSAETADLNEFRGATFCSPQMVSVLHFLVFAVFYNFVNSLAIYVIFVEF